MLRAISAFEVRYHLKQPLFYFLFPLTLLLTFGTVVSDTVQIGGGVGNVHRNSPFVIMQLMTIMNLLLGMFIVTAYVSSSALRDFEYNTQALFFSKPIRKLDYLVGRFSGSLFVSVLMFVGPALGIMIGSLMPWIEPERLGPFTLAPYVYTFLVFLLPNILFMGAVFFALAVATRSMLYTYLGVVGFFVLWAFSSNLLSDLDNQFVASLLDPFGLASLELTTRYWTVAEKNSILPPLTAGGSLLLNRLIWSGVALGIFALGVSIFDPARTSLRRRKARLEEPEAPVAAPVSLHIPAAARSFSFATEIRQFLQQARLEATGVVKSALFLVLVAFGAFNVVGSTTVLSAIFGTSVYPVTHSMLTILEGSYTFLLVVIMIFYGGELVWKERSLKLHDVYDALPIPDWIPLASKLTALWAVTVAFMFFGVLTTIGVQIYHGYYNFELLLYAKGAAIMAVPFLLIGVLSIFIQVLANHKFVGYLLMILYLISNPVLRALHFDHKLYDFAGAPGTPYSDMNGYGHFLRPFFWFNLYWTLFAIFLFGLAVLLRVRGTEGNLKARLRQVRGRFHGALRPVLVVSLLAFAAVGAFIFYNTNVLNKYVPSDVQQDRQADYEKKYRKYKDIPMPRITAVKTEVDIFAAERRMKAHGLYRMKNKTQKPIDVLHVSLNPDLRVAKLNFRDHEVVEKDESQGYTIYRLKQPLQPGEEMPFEFEVEAQEIGFPNSGSDTSLVYNGTFFNNRQYFPSFGYNEGQQLIDRNERRKRGLPPVYRMAKVDDLFARRNTYIATDSDWIDFETTVSTSPDQIAIAPGYLQREWTEKGRRYFHYKMDSPILHFYSYLSADYKVKRDRWKGVAIEIYYHEPHGYNVDRMVDAIKKSLDYFTVNFSPYQHRQVRIIEFPRYAQFAQSFPNTIPYSESIGFIANLEDADAIDYVFYVTAHEVAHQWWAHQVIGGNVQGGTMLSETMAQYSALMVMEKEYGKEKMRRFLKYELDNYLRNRGGELVEEMPLMLVENQQYIHYRKGSLILYALRDYIGEGPLNAALHRYIQQVAFQQPPYTNTPELMKHFEEATPADRRYILDDMFRTITLFENRATEATYTRRQDGKFDVDLTFEAKKIRADGQGKETPIPIDDWIDVGVFGEKPRKGEDPEETELYLQKVHVTQPKTHVRLVVDTQPVRAGIDPYNKLVDRNSDDNRKKVDEKKAGASAAK